MIPFIIKGDFKHISAFSMYDFEVHLVEEHKIKEELK